MNRTSIAVAGTALALLVAALVALPIHNAHAKMMARPSPAMGFTLHIDALKHLAGHPNAVAHHWCKGINDNLTECLLFDSDGPHARLVGVETIVPTKVWAKFSPSEQAQWHYHRTEIAKVHATLPDLSKAEAAKVVASILETYGKIYILWDPMTSQAPVGSPSITVIH